MWIQESPWEKKNLGVESSAVFHLEENDDQTVLPEIIDNRSYVYQEAVIPMNRIDLVNGLLSGGFRFAEVAIRQSMKPVCTLPKAFERHLQDFSFHLADRSEINQVFQTIKSGEIFRTDKISLNPRFGPEIAAHRYANWMETELDRGNTAVYITRCKCESIGFSILKREQDDVVSGLLVGLFQPKKYLGIGVYLGYCTIEAARAMGAKLLKANVSSNNPSVVKLNQMLGYQLETMHYVLTRDQTA